MASKVRNKEEDVILPLSINMEIDLQNGCNRWSYLSVIPINRNWLRQFFKGCI